MAWGRSSETLLVAVSAFCTAEGDAGGATQFSGAYWNGGELRGPLEGYVSVPTLPDGTNTVSLQWHTKNQARNGVPAPSVSTWTGYALDLAAASWQLYRYDGSTLTSISGSVSRTQTANDSFGFQHIGNAIGVYIKPSAGAWSLLGTYYDATYTSGWGGVEIQGFIARLDNYGCGNPPVVSDTPFPPAGRGASW